MDSSDTCRAWSFLNCPNLRIRNPFLANLLNNWRAVLIYVSLILNPVIGQLKSAIFDLAVEICRTFAVLGEDRTYTASGKVWGLFLAGVAFGGRYRSPIEAGWLSERVNEIAILFPLMKDAISAYKNLWDQEREFCDEMEKTGIYIGKSW